MTTRIVVDSSVWVEHFRRRNPKLLALINENRVLTHELLIGELRCGSPPSPRSTSLRLLADLFQIESVDIDEVLAVVEARKMYGSGCGLVDMAVLVATLRTPEARLWSKDKKMQRLATLLGIPLMEGEPAPRSVRLAELSAACPTA
ncbi:PIN domain-containing protein [Roseateles sp.]|uniref:type II toxin-antitoxin system VapC family toxin n=1 Tax=Roseateles sp. TaxID=1971397 RepID=UPI0031DA5BBA